jgi:hypothetical protein
MIDLKMKVELENKKVEFLGQIEWNKSFDYYAIKYDSAIMVLRYTLRSKKIIFLTPEKYIITKVNTAVATHNVYKNAQELIDIQYLLKKV